MELVSWSVNAHSSQSKMKSRNRSARSRITICRCRLCSQPMRQQLESEQYSIIDTPTNRKPIAFASKSLQKVERNYAQIEREGLGALVRHEKVSKVHIRPRHFTLLTNHKSLTTIFCPSKGGILSIAAARLQRLGAHTHGLHVRYRLSINKHIWTC